MARKSKKQNKTLFTLVIVLLVTLVALQYIPGFKNITGKTIPTCTGVQSDSTLCTGAAAPTVDTAATLVTTCTGAACEYRCDTGYGISGTNCVATTCTDGEIDTTNNKYCLSDAWIPQIVDDTIGCGTNNYKCQSDICKNNKCLSQTMLINKYCDVLIYTGDYADLTSCEAAVQAQLTTS